MIPTKIDNHLPVLVTKVDDGTTILQCPICSIEVPWGAYKCDQCEQELVGTKV